MKTNFEKFVQRIQDIAEFERFTTGYLKHAKLETQIMKKSNHDMGTVVIDSVVDGKVKVSLSVYLIETSPKPSKNPKNHNKPTNPTNPSQQIIMVDNDRHDIIWARTGVDALESIDRYLMARVITRSCEKGSQLGNVTEMSAKLIEDFNEHKKSNK